jgi:membrane protein DedA with SNARE-associated domain
LSALTSLQVDSALSYAIALVIPALDAILPVLPSETAIIALGVATAGSTDPRIALLVAFAAAGAFLGDNLAYLLGRRFRPWVERRFFSTVKGAKRRAWAEHSLERFGTQVIIVCRFIPGGRTAVTVTCGLVGYPRRRFVPATAAAAVIWALYAFWIGRLGGKAFEDRPWAGFLVGFGITIVLTGLIEAVRRVVSRRPRPPGKPWRHRNAPLKDPFAAVPPPPPAGQHPHMKARCRTYGDHVEAPPGGGPSLPNPAAGDASDSR